MLTRCVCLQDMSEKQDVVHLLLLRENQEEMDLLEELYNQHETSLDQTKLTQDLQQLRAYAYLHRLRSTYKLTTTP